jgi:hypothetical protein
LLDDGQGRLLRLVGDKDFAGHDQQPFGFRPIMMRNA